ncbi:uncharacterized protein YecE (DUF72 family) [Rubrivivax gelatinosus]|uniref:DUF72 domain-containing protein n=1 Tax=Rubrivivax gelatinosus TaxID=28068 RepID=UPI0018CB95AC|nr:DUF72 domain-containing protein [Rubrivivax gelatinosus]MBG6081220.1 uncharacterized protein YecE (DUF72 family) [Rubrivivax gelatinosus]
MARGTIRIGISGWRYAPWRGVFYPPDLVQRDELAFASRQLPTIELNGSFYSLQTPSSYRAWHAATPEGFVFAVKGPRYITHLRRLKDVRVPLANFFASGLLALGERLGPLLWQFPPQMRYDAARFDDFLALLPHDTTAAATLAAGHDARIAEPWLDAGPRRRLRHAVEIRHASFATPEFVALLRRHRVALVVADTAGRWPLLEDLCADFVYLRLHGDAELYASGYGDAALDDWARRIEAWARGGEVDDARRASPEPAPRAAARKVYVYFDNDVKVHAPYDAAALAQRLGVPTGLTGPRPPLPSPPPPVRARAPGHGRRAS